MAQMLHQAPTGLSTTCAGADLLAVYDGCNGLGKRNCNKSWLQGAAGAFSYAEVRLEVLDLQAKLPSVQLVQLVPLVRQVRKHAKTQSTDIPVAQGVGNDFGTATTSGGNVCSER